MEIGIDFMDRLRVMYKEMGWTHSTPISVDGVEGNLLLFTEQYGGRLIETFTFVKNLYSYVGNFVEDNVQYSVHCAIDGKCENMGMWEAKDVSVCKTCKNCMK